MIANQMKNNAHSIHDDKITNQKQMHQKIGGPPARDEFLASLRRRDEHDLNANRGMSRGRQLQSRLGRRKFMDNCRSQGVLALPLVSSHRSANGKERAPAPWMYPCMDIWSHRSATGKEGAPGVK